MKIIITLALALMTFVANAGGKDSLGIVSPLLNKESYKIDLHLKHKSSEDRTNGFLMIAGGSMFMSIGAMLENNRKVRNLPDGYFGYSKSKDIAFNYSILGIGAALGITGGVIIYRLK